MSTELQNHRNMEQLTESINLAHNIITRDYLNQLEEFEVADIPDEIKELDISGYTRVYKINKLISDKHESVLDKLVTVLNAAYSSKATVISLIEGHKNYTDYYLGVISKDIEHENADTQGQILSGVLTGNFPGLKIDPVRGDKKRELLKQAVAYNYVSSISGIASIRNEKELDYEKYVQGAEHLVNSLNGQEYSIITIADPVSTNQLEQIKTGYESLYTQLSTFLTSQLSFSESESLTSTISHTSSVAKSIGTSVSMTQTYSHTNGWSDSSTKGQSRNRTLGTSIGTIAGAVAGILMPPAAPLLLAAGAGIGSLFGSSGDNSSRTFTSNGSTTDASGTSKTSNTTNTNSDSDTNSEAEGKMQGRTLQYSNENRIVKDLLEKIDKHIESIQKCESFGAFNNATYVISPDPQTNAIVASGFNALMRGDNSSIQTSHINNWRDSDRKGALVKEYISKLSHPLFIEPKHPDVYVSAASICNSYEVAINLALPKRSIAGLPVLEMASFGRNVYAENINSGNRRSIPLGKIYHMGSVEDNRVDLDLKSLAMHTFVTGSTGAGKSNTIYGILHNIEAKGVHFLVIEPAKGEYKTVFSDDKTVNIYGTNPDLAPLLKLNPFKFPKGIHVFEHIDRLTEIFNVCWPMYAAMPAVLKESIEKSYIDCGWNLTKSTNEYKEKYGDYFYPTFSDVARNIKTIIDLSEYDAENKGAYKGSLLTRLESLTNGINGLIFCNDEISSEELFNKNVIVDLSRIGSMETKSLIMGMLVLKLEEFRMSENIAINTDLQHITVLEEAHNLLKRTSTEQPTEGGNLLGKSVEMLTNAIAEMRTYGEGFIIADQAPGLLDKAVIRNTNTKIIMRLPDQEDRELVGRSANLDDDQIEELAKLPCGVAAVYQNDWVEPVLCKVEKYNTDTHSYSYKKPLESDYKVDLAKRIEIASILSKGEHVSDAGRLRDIMITLRTLGLTASEQVMVEHLMKNPPKNPRMTKLAPLMSVLFPKAYDSCKSAYRETRDPSEWTKAVERGLMLEGINDDLDTTVRRDIIQGIMTNYLLLNVNDMKALKDWSERGNLR